MPRPQPRFGWHGQTSTEPIKVGDRVWWLHDGRRWEAYVTSLDWYEGDDVLFVGIEGGNSLGQWIDLARINRVCDGCPPYTCNHSS